MAKKYSVKTHTFRLGTYKIILGLPIAGLCDMPRRKNQRDQLELWTLEGDTIDALNTAIHEAMHAEGISDKYVHDGSPDRIAKFLWRLGWRKED